MGGHAAGEVASQLAVHEFRDAVEAGKRHHRPLRQGGRRRCRPQDILALLEHAVQTACAAIHERGADRAGQARHGHDHLGAALAGDRGFIAHVGDSRIYLLRAGPGGPAHRGPLADQRAHQARQDHARRASRTRPTRPYKNAITRAVGVYETVEVDTLDFEVLPGDQFLLCSDGLHAYLNDKRIIDFARRADDDRRGAAAQKLVDASANAGGGHDNITAVVVRVDGAAAGTAPDDRAEELTRKVDVLEADAALPAPHLQGDHARPQRHRGARVRGRARRSSRRGRRATSCSSCCAARSACTRTARSSPTWPRARTSARWRWSIAAAALGQRDGRGAVARADAARGATSTRSSARSRRCRSSCSGASCRC